ncbi:MAG: universal stress protein [Anaerolineae bacterium]
MDILIAVSVDEHGRTAVSTSSSQAIAWGQMLAQVTGAAPTLLTVAKHESEPVRAVLEKAARMMAGPVSTSVVSGWAVEEIVREVESRRCDLVVMGLRPFPSIVQRLLGTVTERVLPQVACPLLIAKSRPSSLRRILICEGGQAPSLLERFITKLPGLIKDGTEIKVLHVMSQMLVNPAGNGWELQADAQTLIAQHAPEGEILQADVKLLAIKPSPVAAEVRHGLVVDEIMAEAVNGRYDLIVIGRHRTSEWWLADLTAQIVTQADRSILVI